MDSMLDLFLGDRVYDENGKLIKRDFGIKNILAIAVVVFVGYSLMGKNFSVPTLSGKKIGKKMKGGGVPARNKGDIRWAEFFYFVFFFLICYVVWGLGKLIYQSTESVAATVVILLLVIAGCVWAYVWS